MVSILAQWLIAYKRLLKSLVAPFVVCRGNLPNTLRKAIFGANKIR